VNVTRTTPTLTICTDSNHRGRRPKRRPDKRRQVPMRHRFLTVIGACFREMKQGSRGLQWERAPLPRTPMIRCRGHGVTVHPVARVTLGDETCRRLEGHMLGWSHAGGRRRRGRLVYLRVQLRYTPHHPAQVVEINQAKGAKSCPSHVQKAFDFGQPQRPSRSSTTNGVVCAAHCLPSSPTASAYAARSSWS